MKFDWLEVKSPTIIIRTENLTPFTGNANLGKASEILFEGKKTELEDWEYVSEPAYVVIELVEENLQFFARLTADELIPV